MTHTVDLTKHAEAILQPLGYALKDGKFVPVNLPMKIDNTDAILTACAALADSAAVVMREAVANACEEASGNAMENGYSEAAEGMGDAAEIIRTINPATLRTGGG